MLVYFLKNPDIKKIFEIANLYKFNIWIVGGAIRSYLLGQENKDFDFAFDCNYLSLMEAFKNNKFLVDTKYFHYNVLIIRIKNKEYFFTLLRKDYLYNGRHSKVITVNNLKEDSLRRDFTFNAIYLNQYGKIFDFHNGIEDLKKNKIRFIGDYKENCLNDNLRMLRGIRFCSLFRKPQISKKYINFFLNNTNLIKNIPLPKVINELKKIFLNNFSQNSIQLLKIMKLDEFILREIKFDSKHLNERLDQAFNKKF